MGEHENRVVVVTGGAQGIGRAACEAFFATGAQVFAVDVDREALEELPMGIVPIQADLGDPDAARTACEGVLREAGHVDVLINNAGIGGEWRGVLDTPVEEWDRVINLNLRAYWLMVKYLATSMAPGSAIVNIASTRALMSEANTEPYSASKGGVVALTHSLAISLADRKIRVNCISPGWIDVTAYRKASDRKPADLSAAAHTQHPAGRVGVPEDVADACVYLCSKDAGFITGANLVIDGGMTRKMIYEE